MALTIVSLFFFCFFVSVSQIESILNSNTTKRLLKDVPGIDVQQFRSILLHTDPLTGVNRPGLLLSFVRNLFVDSSSVDLNNEAQEGTSTANAQLGIKVGKLIDSNLQTLNEIITLTFNSLLSACLAGMWISVLAFLSICVVMAMFTLNVYTSGFFQHETIVKLFHPVTGYVPSLQRIVTSGGSGNENENENENENGSNSSSGSRSGRVNRSGQKTQKDTMIPSLIHEDHIDDDSVDDSNTTQVFRLVGE